MVAAVALSGALFSMDKLYDYLVPTRLEAEAAVGKRVSIPFAKGNRRREGMVFALKDGSDYGKLKPLDSFLDDTPILDEHSLKLARWMKTRFFCTYYDAIKAMLPAGIWLNAGPVYTLANPVDKEGNYAAAALDAEGEAILDLLYEQEGSAPVSALNRACSAQSLQRLEELGILRCEVALKKTVADKTGLLASLQVPAEEAVEWSRRKRRAAPQQAEILRLLSDLGESSVKELRYFTGAGMNSIKSLEKAGLIGLRQQPAFRRPSFTPSDKPLITGLKEEQQQVYEGLRFLLNRQEACASLLYGVTGSGKTAVYISLIRDVLAQGRQALVLVPEISLTPQLMAVFYSHFGQRVAVLHSSLTTAQRYDEWKRIREGLVDVAIGTRSAVFAPLQRLGLLILDEEQESTYQSENAPRYHARDVAKFRCVAYGAMLLLGSATPSVDSMYEAKQGGYHLFTMRSRYNARPLPQVLIADMKQELKDGNGSCISSILRRELDANLQSGQQSILFLNRRGSSSAVTCPECGHVYACPRCSVNLTYHSANHRMMCHFCGWSQPLEDKCPQCGGILSYTGLGTQKVEAVLQELYPDVPVLRMDADTVSAVNTHEKLLQRFEKEKIPILIGTQMVTKGLDFENVTLVGVLSADQALYAGNFRAQERTFSLITQVVGRAGRGSLSGRAVIQTCTPQSEVIRFAAKQDYDAFYESEIHTRAMQQSPPIRGLYAITVTGSDEALTLRCVTELTAALKRSAGSVPELQVLGPAPAGVLRVNERFRYRVLLCAPPGREVRALTAAALRKFGADSRYKDLVLYGEADPQE